MGTLCHSRTGQRALLWPEFLIGRSSSCGLQLQDARVSSHHAVVRWSGSSWEVKDLGSRNGTYLDGARIEPGRAVSMRAPTELAFGSADDVWVLHDDVAPCPMLVPLQPGEPLLVRDEFLGIPSSDDPQATLYRAQDGQWRLETPEGLLSLPRDGSAFELLGRLWRFCCADVSVGGTATSDARLFRNEVALEFSVSRDEEHVELRAVLNGKVVDLGARSHNYLLLTLARNRLLDSANGLPSTSCGWTDHEQLLSGLKLSAPQLNIDVFRIRQQFANARLQDVINVIDRRPRSKQLRIGVEGLRIRTL